MYNESWDSSIRTQSAHYKSDLRPFVTDYPHARSLTPAITLIYRPCPILIDMARLGSVLALNTYADNISLVFLVVMGLVHRSLVARPEQSSLTKMYRL